MLPGALVLPEEHPIGQLATPGSPSTMVVRDRAGCGSEASSAQARRRVSALQGSRADDPCGSSCEECSSHSRQARSGLQPSRAHEPARGSAYDGCASGRGTKDEPAGRSRRRRARPSRRSSPRRPSPRSQAGQRGQAEEGQAEGQPAKQRRPSREAKEKSAARKKEPWRPRQHDEDRGSDDPAAVQPGDDRSLD